MKCELIKRKEGVQEISSISKIRGDTSMHFAKFKKHLENFSSSFEDKRAPYEKGLESVFLKPDRSVNRIDYRVTV